MDKELVVRFIVCLAIVYAFAFVGSSFSSKSVNSSWYESIKPSITPPNYVFTIVWNILFFLIGLSLFFAWNSSSLEGKNLVAFIFGINLLLNVAWSFLYFGLHNIMWALVDLIFIWITTLIMILALWRINKFSSVLLIPYFLWLSFAFVLNYLSLK
jgi:tryptophan-rich sensory protein